ncbi:MAG TPA: serine hydrolase domain-containing protein, partial [Anaerolineaceae bacterium]|nr:serine hydrolase domain-containing protein [Anaerolineaceae bacterium]
METTLTKIDRYLESAIEPWKAVGLVVGIIKNDQVIFKKSYGERTIHQEPMTTETRFAIGSATKAFTAAAIAILIRQGKIRSWDDTVKTYLPYYAAADEYAQEHMTIRDLLCMRSGYSPKGYDNMLFHGSHFSMDEIIARSKYIPFELGFRERMRYDNLNYL